MSIDLDNPSPETEQHTRMILSLTERVKDLERIQSNWEALAEQYLNRATNAEDLALQACDWLEARTDKQARTFHAACIRAALAKGGGR